MLLKVSSLAVCLFASSHFGVFAAPRSRVVARATDQDYISYTQSVMNDLQKRYFDSSEGLWDSAWWQSGEVLNMIATMAYRRPNDLTSLNDMALVDIFNAVLNNAPLSEGAPNFIGGFFDDDLWYANAWISVYRWANASSDSSIAGQAQNYLGMAQTIVNNAQKYVAKGVNSVGSGGQKNCYGLQWNKTDATGGINAIENSLYLKATAQLAWIKKFDSKASFIDTSIDYETEATNMTTFFSTTGLITPAHLVYDGLDSVTCQAVTTSSIWTYNTGVLMSGLSHYTLATSDGGTASSLADSLAQAGISYFQNAAVAPNILFEVACQDSTTACNGDEQQFKGIFASSVLDLWLTTSQMETYRTWLQANAERIYMTDRTADNQLGLVWSGPPNGDITMQEDSSGLEALVGAACITDP